MNGPMFSLRSFVGRAQAARGTRWGERDERCESSEMNGLMNGSINSYTQGSMCSHDLIKPSLKSIEKTIPRDIFMSFGIQKPPKGGARETRAPLWRFLRAKIVFVSVLRGTYAGGAVCAHPTKRKQF